MSEWQAGMGMEPAGDEDNTTKNEPEPRNAADYEDPEFDEHDFAVEEGGSVCVTCDLYYDEGNHTN